jgi:hypothetical protein
VEAAVEPVHPREEVAVVPRHLEVAEVEAVAVRRDHADRVAHPALLAEEAAGVVLRLLSRDHGLEPLGSQ